MSGRPRHRPASSAPVAAVLFLLGGSFAAVFLLIAFLVSAWLSALLAVMAAGAVLFAFALWVRATDVDAPERWSPTMRRVRLLVATLVAVTIAIAGFRSSHPVEFRGETGAALLTTVFLMLLPHRQTSPAPKPPPASGSAP